MRFARIAFFHIQYINPYSDGHDTKDTYSRKWGASMSRLILFFLLFLLLPVASVFSANSDLENDSELLSGYMTIVDEQGSIVFQTGLTVRPGDEFVNEDNRLYEVTSVDGTLARSRYVRDETVSTLPPEVIPVQGEESTPPPLIGIYHTHTDECYIPTDGTATSKGNGSIMKVGETFATRLTELGYEVDHRKTLHDPHDANAYHRSRRTFAKLLGERPVALFDVHRDSAPLKAYKTSFNGQDAAKILLVVGRQNQNRATTMNYAKSIKSAADNKYKGLIRGIFIAHGNYNQDLNPRAMLLEVGTQYNSRAAADHSITLFADIVPTFLANTAGNVAQAGPIASGNGVAASNMPNSGTGWDMLYMVGAVIAGGAAFLVLSTGSLSEAKQKFSNFTKREFGDVFRFRKKRKN